MVTSLHYYRADKQRMEENNDTSSENYHSTCRLLKGAEESVGEDWDGVTVLEDSNDKTPLTIPVYVLKAIPNGDIKSVLKWITANRTEDRANAVASAEVMRSSVLTIASLFNQLALMALLLQLGADVEEGITVVIQRLFMRSLSLGVQAKGPGCF